MGFINIKGMSFHAYHGCFKEEQLIGTEFLVDLKIMFDTNKAEKNDSLEDTIDYQDIYNIVKKEMDIPSKLIEHVARRIVDAVLLSEPSIIKIKIKLSKLNPAIGGKVEAVSVSF